MLDMGFKPQVDRIVRQMPPSTADDVLLGHARRDGRRARARTRAIPFAARRRRSSRATNNEVEHRFVSVKPDDKVETLAEAPA